MKRSEMVKRIFNDDNLMDYFVFAEDAADYINIVNYILELAELNKMPPPWCCNLITRSKFLFWDIDIKYSAFEWEPEND